MWVRRAVAFFPGCRGVMGRCFLPLVFWKGGWEITVIHSLKLTYPLKIDGWKTSFLLGWPISRALAVSFREGMSWERWWNLARDFLLPFLPPKKTSWFRFRDLYWMSNLPRYCGWKKSCTPWDVQNPVKNWDTYHINWCRILSINSISPGSNFFSRNVRNVGEGFPISLLIP